MRKEQKHEWLEELKDAPNLSRLSVQEPFQAPEGYFEKFSASLPDKIKASQSHWLNRLIENIRRPLVAVPLIAILAGAIIWFNYSMKDEFDSSCLATNEEVYTMDVIDALDETVLCEYIESADISGEEELLLETITEESLINEL